MPNDQNNGEPVEPINLSPSFSESIRRIVRVPPMGEGGGNPPPLRDLIPILNQGNDLVADSRNVAKVFGIQHKNLLELMANHVEQINQLGHVRFETERGSNRPQGGGTAEKFAWLTFDHIAFLLTLTRSTEATKEFRLRLIIAFRNAREKLRPVDSILLSIPAQWKKTFKDEFYRALLGLYGDSFDKTKNKPSWVGKWTNRFIYEPIYQGLSDELKAKRAAYVNTSGKDADWMRLHQFLELHAKDDLVSHITKITTLLQISGSKNDFIEHFLSLFHQHTQLKLFREQLEEDFGDS